MPPQSADGHPDIARISLELIVPDTAEKLLKGPRFDRPACKKTQNGEVLRCQVKTLPLPPYLVTVEVHYEIVQSLIARATRVRRHFAVFEPPRCAEHSMMHLSADWVSGDRVRPSGLQPWRGAGPRAW